MVIVALNLQNSFPEQQSAVCMFNLSVSAFVLFCFVAHYTLYVGYVQWLLSGVGFEAQPLKCMDTYPLRSITLLAETEHGANI